MLSRVSPSRLITEGSAHAVGVSYSGLYEEGEVEHINCGIGPNLNSDS